MNTKRTLGSLVAIAALLAFAGYWYQKDGLAAAIYFPLLLLATVVMFVILERRRRAGRPKINHNDPTSGG